MSRTGSYPGIVQASWLLILTLALIVAFGTILAMLDSPLAFDPLATRLVSLGALTLVTVVALTRTKTRLADVLPVRGLPLVLVPPMLLMLVGVTVLVSEAQALLPAIVPVPAVVASRMPAMATGAERLWPTVAVIVVAAPIIEETFFRGLLLRGFAARYAGGLVIGVSALMFAVFRLNPWQFVGPLVLGVVLGWWVLHTGSIVPALVGHALHNALPLVLAPISSLELFGSSLAPLRAGVQPLWVNVGAVSMVIAGSWMLAAAFGKRNATVAPAM